MAFVFHFRQGSKYSVIDELEQKTQAEYAESACGALRDGTNSVHAFCVGRDGTRGAFVCRFGEQSEVLTSILRIPLGEGTLLVKLGKIFQRALKDENTFWGWLRKSNDAMMDVSSPDTAFFLSPDSVQRKTIDKVTEKINLWAELENPVETSGTILTCDKCFINLLTDQNDDAWLSVFTRENTFREYCAGHAERYYKNGGIAPNESVYVKFLDLVNAVQYAANISRGRIVTAIIEQLINDCGINPSYVHGNLNDVVEGYSCVSCCFDEETRTLRRNCAPSFVDGDSEYKPVIHYHGGVIIAKPAERPLYLHSAPYSIEMERDDYDALYKDMFEEEQRLTFVKNIFSTEKNQ